MSREVKCKGHILMQTFSDYTGLEQDSNPCLKHFCTYPFVGRMCAVNWYIFSLIQLGYQNQGATSVLSFMILSRKIYPSVFLVSVPDSKWHDHGYEMSMSQPQTKPPVTSKQRREHLETQYQIIFQWICVKHPWKHPFIQMRGYLISWEKIISLSWPVFILV